MKTNVIMLRHGSTDHNTKKVFSGSGDLPLNVVGQAEVKEAARKLSHERFDVVAYGKKLRVIQTAQAVLEQLVQPPNKIIQSEIIREMDFGVMEGLDAGQIQVQYPREWKRYMEAWQTFAFPGGDNVKQYYDACAGFAHQLVQENYGSSILIVGHMGFICCASAALTGEGMGGVFNRRIGNAGILRLEI